MKSEFKAMLERRGPIRDASLGLDARTLQNWEQGRNRPDAAVLSLVALFDRHPALVREIAYEAPV